MHDTIHTALPVVAALIQREDGLILLCQRSERMKRALHWEFPGGKIEPGETGPQALKRECREELGIGLNVYEPVAETVCAYPDVTIDLTLYRSTIRDGVPAALEHRQLHWIRPDELGDYDLCPADRALAGQLRQPAEKR